MRQLSLEHQGQKVTAYGAFPRQTLIGANGHFAAEPQNLTVGWGTNHSGNVIVSRDEIPRNNHIIPRLVTAFRHFLACTINLASVQESPCSLINSRDCRWSLFRLRRMIPRSRSSSVEVSSRDTNSCVARRMTSDLLRNGVFRSVFKRSMRFNVDSSMVIAIVFI
jgi:hypothetical protein